jgi:purine-binding chemotaxis protein CheW
MSDASANDTAARVLHARARALARPQRDEAAGARIELITFGLAGETAALPIESVREVFRPRDLALLPGAQPPTYAVTPWRGLLLTVLDIRDTLGTAGTGISDLSHVIVVGHERSSVGVLIDRVRAIESVPVEDLLAPARDGSGRGRLLKALTRDAVLVIDAAALLEHYG